VYVIVIFEVVVRPVAPTVSAGEGVKILEPAIKNELDIDMLGSKVL
jgi:hypothetical protein